MNDIAKNLTGTRAGRDALTLVFASSLIKDEAVAEEFRSSAKLLVGISRDASLSREYDISMEDALTSLMMRQIRTTSHHGNADGLMDVMIYGPRRAASVMGLVRAVSKQFPPATLFADTAPPPGQPCILITDGLAVIYRQSDMPGRLEHLGGGPAVLVAQNQDGSVMVTNEDTGSRSHGVLLLSPGFPDQEPVKDDQIDGPSSGP